MKRFVKELGASLRRQRKADPFTFWVSLYSFFIGNAALLLVLVRLFRLLHPR